jgi:hypothetical protein
VIELAKGKTAIEVGATAALIPTLKAIKQAVQNGEVDAALDALVMPFRKTKPSVLVPKAK